MSEFNYQQEQLRQRILEELEENGGSCLTSELRDTLFSEFGYQERNKQSFHRHLLRIRKKMDESGDITSDEEHTTSSRPEWRWIRK